MGNVVFSGSGRIMDELQSSWIRALLLTLCCNKEP